MDKVSASKKTLSASHAKAVNIQCRSEFDMTANNGPKNFRFQLARIFLPCLSFAVKWFIKCSEVLLIRSSIETLFMRSRFSVFALETKTTFVLYTNINETLITVTANYLLIMNSSSRLFSSRNWIVSHDLILSNTNFRQCDGSSYRLNVWSTLESSKCGKRRKIEKKKVV